MAKTTSAYNEQTVNELHLYTDNDRGIYEGRLKPIYTNLAKKQSKGVYEPEKAQKLYMNAVNDSAKKYTREFGTPGSNIFTVADRKEVARRLERENRDELKWYLPQKKSPSNS